MNIFENVSSTLYTVAPVSVNDATDDYATIINEVTHFGGTITSIEDDMFVVACSSKQSVEDIADLLDDDNRIDEYSIQVYEHTGTGVPNKIDGEDIDIDKISNFNNVEVEFVVFLNSDYVDYDSYTDVDDDELTESYVNTNKKQPLWLALSGTRTSLKYGSFIVTPHPVRHDAILVHVEYKYDEADIGFIEENVVKIKNDINTINNGLVNKTLLAANYELEDNINFDFNLDMSNPGHFISAPAVYARNKSTVNIPEIMEAFGETTLFAETAVINEVKRKVKINFKGKKRIKLKCLKGYKYDSSRKACVKITGREKATDRKSKIKMTRTKKSKGSALKRSTNRKTKKAMRFRKQMGK